MRNVETVRGGFVVLENGSALQTAVMVLEPGEESGPYGNEHPSSEQVLLIVDGSLEAEIGSERFAMNAGDSVVVPKAAPHRFINRSQKRTLTFNVYSPKAY
jgi:mannose-6-phosphate isomerase-like protein (cupin superfamily)